MQVHQFLSRGHDWPRVPSSGTQVCVSSHEASFWHDNPESQCRCRRAGHISDEYAAEREKSDAEDEDPIYVERPASRRAGPGEYFSEWVLTQGPHERVKRYVTIEIEAESLRVNCSRTAFI